MKKIFVISAIIILLAILLSIFIYPRLPDPMPSHWNAQGEVDGYMSKFWAVSMMPIISILIMGLMLALPNIDPLKKNISKFRSYYDMFILAFVIFFAYIHVLTLAYSLNFVFNMTVMIMPAIAIIFWGSAILMEKSKRNWFVGIKNPWTLSSDVVWEKTHKLAGKLFKVLAIIMIVGLFFDKYLMWMLFVSIVVVVVWLFVYSYLIYNAEKKKG